MPASAKPSSSGKTCSPLSAKTSVTPCSLSQFAVNVPPCMAPSRVVRTRTPSHAARAPVQGTDIPDGGFGGVGAHVRLAAMPVCSNCSQDNPANARFCLNCGSPLAAPAAKGEERKVVSVLLADLVGFTAASEAADPEDVRARLRPYHQRLKELIEARGGTVEKFIGDAVVGLFGAPISHEDDAERAVRAALRIQQAIEELNGEDPGLGLRGPPEATTGRVAGPRGARLGSGEGWGPADVVTPPPRLQGSAPTEGA